MIGRKLGRYHVRAKLGQGGMGEVFLAEDTSLGRKAALKFLAPPLQQDAAARERLIREAKSAAALDDPYICHVYEVATVDGSDFIAMEYVEGRVLGSWLAEGSLPVKEAVRQAMEIAEALDHAHAKGIVHRDLKPSNIMVTPQRHIKVMDFGLAKRLLPPGASTSEQDTLAGLTGAGCTPGTLAYMAPEQLRGQEVDQRSDIFSFGIILCEMVTGIHPFLRNTPMDTASAILSDAAASLPGPVRDVPALLQHVIRKALAKDPARRYQSAHEIQTDLAEVLERAGDAGNDSVEPLAAPAIASRVPVPGRVRLAAAALLLLAVAGSALTTRWFYRESSVRATDAIRSIITLPPGYQLFARNDSRQGPTRSAIAISPDGRFLVYSAATFNQGSDNTPRLYLRPLDQLDAKPIAGTDGGTCPFLSPDGTWVGFHAGGKLMKVPTAGGTPTVLGEMPKFFGAAWGTDNLIVFAPNHNVGLSRISADGGTPEILTAPDPGRGEYSHRLPSWLPNGRGVVFTVVRQMHDMQPKTAVMARGSRQWRVILEDAADARYAPSGHLIFARRGALMAVRFDLETLNVVGQPAPVVPDVMQSLNVDNSEQHTAAAQYAFSGSGGLIYGTGGIVPDKEDALVFVDENGNAREILRERRPFFAPRLSPDGRQLVYQTLGEQKCIWVCDLERGIPSRLTTEGAASMPVWTPDGKRVTFGWAAVGARNLFEQPADGSEPMRPLARGAYDQFPSSWRRDGSVLAVVESTEDGNDILFYRPGEAKAVPFLATRFRERQPDFSPDGQWLAYTSDESGRDEIYVRPVAGPGGKTPISTSGGTEPLWARDGRRLFYRGDGYVWAVDIRWEPALSAGKPRRLFADAQYAWGVNVRSYDIALDGRRFLMVKQTPDVPRPITAIVLVQHWLEELQRTGPR